MKKTGNDLSLFAMEPLLPEIHSSIELVNLATELIAKSNTLAARLNPITANAIGNLVRPMNCYYSNLIEGHDTHPRDISRALENNYSNNKQKRALQLEAKAHIEVQQQIDSNVILFSVSSDYICEIHKKFCELLPEEFLWATNPDNNKQLPLIPGHLRTEWVQVGKHIPPDPDRISEFLKRFTEAYKLDSLNEIQKIIAVAASHHRLLWIHPFLDGNGRITRLFSHAFLKHIGVGSSLWSISRGLSRNVETYKAKLIDADGPRRSDLDGCGNLSAQALKDFCKFFLNTCIDQISYMNELIEPTQLSKRIETYIEEQVQTGKLSKGSYPLLREVLFTGEITRGQAGSITGHKERQARSVLNELVKAGLLKSDTPKGPVRLRFPINVVERWFPKLYPK